MFSIVVELIEETRRLGEERLAAEQAKAEVVSMRKNYSEADVTQSLSKMIWKSNSHFLFSREFCVYKVKSKFCRMKMKSYGKKPNK